MYADNANIIPEEIPELLSYMEEVMPDKSGNGDSESNITVKFEYILCSLHEEIDKLRLSATAALSERRDVVVISSVSCIYGLGSPEDFLNMMVSLRPGMVRDRAGSNRNRTRNILLRFPGKIP